jgi:hypothetical protein
MTNVFKPVNYADSIPGRSLLCPFGYGNHIYFLFLFFAFHNDVKSLCSRLQPFGVLMAVSLCHCNTMVSQGGRAG